jgi:hypothetical protein
MVHTLYTTTILQLHCITTLTTALRSLKFSPFLGLCGKISHGIWGSYHFTSHNTVVLKFCMNFSVSPCVLRVSLIWSPPTVQQFLDTSTYLYSHNSSALHQYISQNLAVNKPVSLLCRYINLCTLYSYIVTFTFRCSARI